MSAPCIAQHCYLAWRQRGQILVDGIARSTVEVTGSLTEVRYRLIDGSEFILSIGPHGLAAFWAEP